MMYDIYMFSVINTDGVWRLNPDYHDWVNQCYWKTDSLVQFKSKKQEMGLFVSLISPDDEYCW